ncbi:hypothetical protein P153DRAFT_363058 [Dothidotthia symphoricarpi CBS 119687]|uniref:Uncharacterized protein n=1 Tax=Dothidotthia symphoricarpi CBS 119687 TaxID=1392245 RepID=A0A6A6AT68_9PLEO|nr:uncharacterized protein P153DRAFT_363058 [Dothidotthia symphoricarpi CBS 119687]KAF2134047.1 hypothetical protein P153DRAFT_363058 [Dothidotthia symphoricarpi CBS 119687]
MTNLALLESSQASLGELPLSMKGSTELLDMMRGALLSDGTVSAKRWSKKEWGNKVVVVVLRPRV